ncbi:hypothetical protein TWF730_006263 [Orbilia blumenaviensis]|uniref:F-box domain-containing protein n=1 Tax=Orbilia blumenaviensis TaxID=1796055 RepID=A0AAV9VDT2_9PEZI
MPISTIPTELLTHIFSFLPWQDHLTASQVCRLWYSIFLSPPIKSNRYVLVDPQTTLCPRMHNLFWDIGLECTVNVFTGDVSKIIFVLNENEGIQDDQDRAEATVDLTKSEIIEERLLHFHGWRYEDNIKDQQWKMGVCIMWNQLGYEYGSQKDRQFYRQDWFQFVRGDGEAGEASEAPDEIVRGEVDLDISVKGFISVLAKHVLKFDALKTQGKPEMRLRLGMYDRMGIVVIRNVREASKVFDLSLDLFDGIHTDKDRKWISE